MDGTLPQACVDACICVNCAAMNRTVSSQGCVGVFQRLKCCWASSLSRTSPSSPQGPVRPLPHRSTAPNFLKGATCCTRRSSGCVLKLRWWWPSWARFAPIRPTRTWACRHCWCSQANRPGVSMLSERSTSCHRRGCPLIGLARPPTPSNPRQNEERRQLT